jgi:hypothetical protein
MKHGELVKIAERWLRKKNHPVVLSDVRCNSISEQPDAIGWKNHGSSSLIECKVSLSDGRADRSKSFRREPSTGMGYWRWLMAPVDIGKKIPRQDGWGLLVVYDDRSVRIAVQATPFVERNRDAESTLLVRAVRAVTESWGRRMFGDIAPPMVDGDPHPSTSRLLRDLRRENERLRLDLRAARAKAEPALDSAHGLDSAK